MPQTIDINVIPNQRREINDLIGKSPSWLLRSGITMVAIVIFSIIGLSAWIKYPDKITAAGTVTSSQPPIALVTKSAGYIQSMHHVDGDLVTKADQVLTIHNTTSIDDVHSLHMWMDNYKRTKDVRRYVRLPIPTDLQLGSIQNEYAQLILQYHELQQILNTPTVFRQINTIDREIQKLKKLNASQKREKGIYHQELNLQQKDHNRNQSLHRGNVISTLELERSQTALLQKQRQYEGMENTIIQNTIRIEQLQMQQLSLQKERRATVQSQVYQINQTITRIENAMHDWQEQYIITVPIGGELTLLPTTVTNGYVKAGQTIGYILPQSKENPYISIQAPMTNVGKIEVGQQTIIKFDAYPYKEYGVVTSTVAQLSRLPYTLGDQIQYYEIKTQLADCIITDYDTYIPHRPNMTAAVEIITKDKTLLQRVFDQFLRLLHTNT